MTDPNFDFPALREAQGKLDAARTRQKQIFTEAGPEMDMGKVKCITGDNAAKVKAIQDAEAEMKDLKGEVEGLRSVARAAADAKGYEAANDRDTKGGGGTQNKSFAELFDGKIGEMKSHRHQNFTIDAELKANEFQRSGGTGGWDPFDARSDHFESMPLRPAVQVVNYIPSGTISQSDYKYMEETTHTDGATNIAELGAYTTAVLALTERSRAVEKVGVWIAVSDEQLEDEPAAGAYLRNRLTQQVSRRIDQQVLQGTGTTPQIMGTENVVGIQTQALGGDTIPDAALKLFTSIRSDGFAEPNVGFISPTKWQNVALERTADGLYIWGHPSQVGPTTLWGVPIVQTTAVTSTKLVAGDYATYAMLFMRRGMDVQITNAHSDFFTKGTQALRADIRTVMVHFRPKAFGTVTGL